MNEDATILFKDFQANFISPTFLSYLARWRVFYLQSGPELNGICINMTLLPPQTIQCWNWIYYGPDCVGCSSLGRGGGVPLDIFQTYYRFFYDFWHVVRLRYKKHFDQKIYRITILILLMSAFLSNFNWCVTLGLPYTLITFDSFIVRI